METHDLVRMANQISSFFKSYGEAEAVDGIADHINKFWEPRMRTIFFTLLDAGDDRLDPLVVKAAAHVKRPKAA
jgi:formate dehydrogenase subunit delta